MEKINRRVYIRVTNKCNRQCSFCYYRDDPKKPEDMSLATLKEIIDKEMQLLPKNGYLRIELTGGEPSLCKNINEIIEHLIGLPKLYIALETNGTNLGTPEFLELLLKLKKPHFLKISLNSELINSDGNWVANVVSFQKFANENNINYVFNTRFKDLEDKAVIQRIVNENKLHPSYKDITYYPIHDANLHRDGKLPSYGVTMIIYDVDGEVLTEHNIINKNNSD